MARQVGDVLYYGTSGWANGYVGPDGRGVVRWKPPGMTRKELRARVHAHVGCLGQQVQRDDAGRPLPVVDWRHVSGWVGLDEVESLCRVRLDWKGILRGRRVGDVVVLLGVEVGYVRGSRVVRVGCGSRLWVTWAGALELVPRRRVGRRVKRVRVPDRGMVRGVKRGVVVEVRGRDG